MSIHLQEEHYTRLKNRKTARLEFYTDVVSGLTASPKALKSKYFYDAEGDALFQRIMQCPEYYLTDCELEILSHQTDAIASAIQASTDAFNVVELGPGDASKSSYLLKELLNRDVDYTYMPIDISHNVLSLLQTTLPEQLPGLRMQGFEGDYLEMLKETEQKGRRRLVMFMGSSIGNVPPQGAVAFCRELYNHLLPGDVMLIGFDLKKNPMVILDAYNDSQGITRAFNLNLLKRINRELGGDFNLDHFAHYPTYDPHTGSCKSYLVSRRQQQVHIGPNAIRFAEGEPVFMEISQKYSLEEIDNLAVESGFVPLQHFVDSKRWFVDVLWQR
ncbi:L-histidine N(alpha)-methyltransferase [Chryseolinea lacunae]|uniref:L-histidine N(Alpha)-methyltransferase n=1 Tax=Chryseolinea lacunae TaxID=2801331 RepID=A0ABS1L1D8_9BACT|nr:L-histidine N(alpha)-methyltransferase [Chryseolinea lacunae]MBL0745337.1 L-histidine N(alpha)-methyltransferase [Chryseolinea lacunae]